MQSSKRDAYMFRPTFIQEYAHISMLKFDQPLEFMDRFIWNVSGLLVLEDSSPL